MCFKDSAQATGIEERMKMFFNYLVLVGGYKNNENYNLHKSKRMHCKN